MALSLEVTPALSGIVGASGEAEVIFSDREDCRRALSSVRRGRPELEVGRTERAGRIGRTDVTKAKLLG